MKNGSNGFYNRVVKRILDMVVAIILVVPVSLLLGLCCLAIKLESPGPALFIQERPGYKGKIFKIYKLRTMCTETERDGQPLSDMERMTKTGAVLRKLSLDEFPQIYNILKGEMSFIGPRPLLVQYLDLYIPEQMRRHDVMPGITGLAQVNGRNNLEWEQRFEQDIWYVDHVSFAVDAEIVRRSIMVVLQHSGINSSINETMHVFKGKQETREK